MTTRTDGHAPFGDALIEAGRATAPIIVGIDPHPNLLPAPFAAGSGSVPDLAGFGRAVLDRAAGRVAAVKIQAAFFERWGIEGWTAFLDLAAAARERGILTIADAKRGDIASTARAYADAFFPAFDALTVNPYLGEDGVRPFLDAARPHGGGVFVLVRTSNPSAAAIQELAVDSSGDRGEGEVREPLYMRVARLVADWSAEHRGSTGYGDVGAVVGATAPDVMAACRRAMPGVPFLVPGVGSQGGRPEDVAGALDDAGEGVFVSASRSVTFPHLAAGETWEVAVEAALARLETEVRSLVATQGAGSER